MSQVAFIITSVKKKHGRYEDHVSITLRVIDLEGLAILHDIAFIRLKNSVFEREFQNLFADL